MRTIYAPSEDRLDRWEECADALEPAFMQLIDRARKAGWCSQEVLVALSLLADLAQEAEREERPTLERSSSLAGATRTGTA